MAVGAIAAGAYGIPRSTRGVDLLVAVHVGGGIAAVMEALEPLLVFDPPAQFDTLTWGCRQVGVTKSKPNMKVELFELFDDPFVQAGGIRTKKKTICSVAGSPHLASKPGRRRHPETPLGTQQGPGRRAGRARRAGDRFPRHALHRKLVRDPRNEGTPGQGAGGNPTDVRSVLPPAPVGTIRICASARSGTCAAPPDGDGHPPLRPPLHREDVRHKNTRCHCHHGLAG